MDRSGRAGGIDARDTQERRRRYVAATLAAGLALLALGLVATLSHSAPRRAGTNGILVHELIAVTPGGGTFCQPRELIPAGTGALRPSLKAAGGPGTRVSVAVLRGRAAVARGSRPAGWRGESVVVPLRTPLRDDVLGHVCITLGAHAQTALGGQRTDKAVAARTGRSRLKGRIRIDYLRPGRESWWAFASTLGHRMAIGRASTGISVAVLAALLLLSSIALSAWQLVRREA